MGKETKIIKVSVSISKTLYDEIERAWKHLNDKEKQKTMGKKKESYSKLDASHKLGKYLNSLRKTK